MAETGVLTAHDLAKRQREISVAEFFTKNRHLLGFDNPKRALLSAVKEAVDNSLDACEEARILPTVEVAVRQLAEDRFVIKVRDNGPGILKSQVPRIFGKLLYGSKFHRLRMARGQQGIGISAAGMYGQLTTAKPTTVISRCSASKPAYKCQLFIDSRTNEPKVVAEEEIQWDIERGTEVEIELLARYQKGRQSVDEYLYETFLANPHLTLRYQPPEGEPVSYERITEKLPAQPKEIRPHPYGVELGALLEIAERTKARNVKTFLMTEFCRVSERVATELLQKAGLPDTLRPSRLKRPEGEKLIEAIAQTKIMAPPSDCIVPIGEQYLQSTLESLVKADFYTAVTRSPSVYRGNPFLVEAALAYGGELPLDEPARVLRFANRVPLLYQQSACAITRSIATTVWKSYGVQQPGGSLPVGPLLIAVHIASVWVPFTSESKEAIAHYDEIIKEMKLALQECGRRLGRHIRKGRREAEAQRKRSYIEKYIPHIGIALRELLDLSEEQERRVCTRLGELLERSRS